MQGVKGLRAPPGLTEQHWDWSWRKQAACLGEDPELFYTPGSADIYPPEQLHKAKAICAGCSVREQCLAVAMATSAWHDHGIWGGLTAEERRALRKRRCLRCGVSLEGKRPYARYCSEDCRQRSERDQQRLRAQLLLERKRRERVCIECGGEVPITRRTGRWMTTCSQRCYQRRYHRELERMKRAAAKQQEAVVA